PKKPARGRTVKKQETPVSSVGYIFSIQSLRIKILLFFSNDNQSWCHCGEYYETLRIRNQLQELSFHCQILMTMTLVSFLLLLPRHGSGEESPTTFCKKIK